MKLSDQLKAAAKDEAENMRQSLAGVIAVVIATNDGFDIASAVTAGVDAARIAAMASSISAIGAVVSQEANLGPGKSVTINTERGFAYISSVKRQDVELVVNVIANGHGILAQVAYRSNECVKRLVEA